MSSFYLVWRNHYIRRLIRNIVCRDILVRVDKEYLEENHRYLSLFSNSDKLDYNIRIHFMGDASDYLDINKSNRDVINELIIHTDFDLNEIHDGVHTLKLESNGTLASGVGQLPDSITNLTLSGYTEDQEDELSPPPIIQQILSNLPSKLQELRVSDEFIQRTTALPQSLTDLYYGYKYDNLKWLVVPPNKVYKNCALDLDSIESFEWLVANKFISNVNVELSAVPLLKSRQLPSHVTKVYLEPGIVEPNLLLPETVEYLLLSFGTPFSHITHLKLLHIYGEYPIKLEKGVLPASLELLTLTYDEPLEPGVLPNQLTTLNLSIFKHPLCINVLPASLTCLTLPSFNQPLNASVLPSKLKTLHLQTFKQPEFLSDSLPVSLTDLSLSAFKGSYKSCQPLDNLKKLQIHSLVPSVAGLLTNVKKLDMWVNNKVDDTSGTCLYHTSIESLYLNSKVKSTLYPNSFPPTLKYLSLSNVYIRSDNVIPSSCRYLKSRNSHIDPKCIPQSVKLIKSIK
ncbi:hypothetical protein CYY_003179 [Polysphondylium violaceum]|uniref:FNIP repeat-containing protein n=1 Tax=Polysphondylium violaceum TaxID=133409 RepID=A0A8J4V1K6_9MYCE|nr:hypothetical protein CYY_003179 [Polysphondylium violaceum]